MTGGAGDDVRCAFSDAAAQQIAYDACEGWRVRMTVATNTWRDFSVACGGTAATITVTQSDARLRFSPEWLAKQPFADRIALARELLEGTGRVVVERKQLEAAHACMRETGWQLAPAHAARGSDGVLESACAEVVAQIGEMLGDAP